MRLQANRQAPIFMSSYLRKSMSDLCVCSLNSLETGMSLKNHLNELVLKHRALEKELSEAMAHPATTDAQLADIKRRKLKIKDEITNVERQVKLAA
jgi:hypothetical protein